jgi:hypothetical protein
MHDGIQTLRDQRGGGRVSFDEVADHLVDYCERNPGHAEVINRFAEFFAAVEFLPHDHDADPDRGLPAPGTFSVRSAPRR